MVQTRPLCSSERRTMHIIMNPPYSGSLHLKILREAMKHSNDIVNLSPANFLENAGFYAGWNKPYEGAPLVDSVLEHTESIEIIPHRLANDYFGLGNQIGCLGVYHCSSKAGGISINDYFSELDIKLSIKTYNLKPSLWSKYVRKNSSIKHYVNVYKWHEDNIPENCIIVPNGNGNNSYVIPFSSEEECANFRSSFKTKIMRYIIGKLKEINPAHLPYLGDYTHPWTDDMLYKYFGLTDDEIKTIENAL